MSHRPVLATSQILKRFLTTTEFATAPMQLLANITCITSKFYRRLRIIFLLSMFPTLARPKLTTHFIALCPSLNDTIHQLAMVSHSNHTLSPYTHSLAHYTAHSVLPWTLDASVVQAVPDRQSVKTMRKWTQHISMLKGSELSQLQPQLSPLPSISLQCPDPSFEFDHSNID